MEYYPNCMDKKPNSSDWMVWSCDMGTELRLWMGKYYLRNTEVIFPIRPDNITYSIGIITLWMGKYYLRIQQKHRGIFSQSDGIILLIGLG